MSRGKDWLKPAALPRHFWERWLSLSPHPSSSPNLEFSSGEDILFVLSPGESWHSVPSLQTSSLILQIKMYHFLILLVKLGDNFKVVVTEHVKRRGSWVFTLIHFLTYVLGSLPGQEEVDVCMQVKALPAWLRAGLRKPWLSASLTLFKFHAPRLCIRALECSEACYRGGQTQCIRPALRVVSDMLHTFRKCELGLCKKLHLSKIIRIYVHYK